MGNGANRRAKFFRPTRRSNRRLIEAYLPAALRTRALACERAVAMLANVCAICREFWTATAREAEAALDVVR